MALKDDINIPLLVTLGLVTGLLVIVAIIATEALVYRTRYKQLQAQYADQERRGLVFYRQVYEPQAKAINVPQATPLNQEQTLFQISIEDAKKAIIANKGFVPAQ